MARPKKGAHEARTERVYVYFSEAELARVQAAADQAGYFVSVFIRQTALAQQFRQRKSRQAQELTVALNRLAGQVNKIGNNLNQLARQANGGDFPVRHSVEHVLVAIRRTADEIISTIKRV